MSLNCEKGDVGSHPTINKFVTGCILEQGDTETYIAKIRVGETFPRRKDEIQRDDRIKKHVEEWNKSFKFESLFEFLDILILLTATLK